MSEDVSGNKVRIFMLGHAVKEASEKGYCVDLIINGEPYTILGKGKKPLRSCGQQSE